MNPAVPGRWDLSPRFCPSVVLPFEAAALVTTHDSQLTTGMIEKVAIIVVIIVIGGSGGRATEVREGFIMAKSKYV